MPRNIVLVCLDSVRKDVFDQYAPELGSLSDVSAPQCRAASSWSVPSHGSMFTGLLPHQHGLHTHNRDFSTLPRDRTFLSSLPDEYRTAGISANVYVGPAYGFDGHFGTFVDAPRYQYFADGLNAVRHFQETSEEGVSLYLSFLKAAANHDHPIKSLFNGLAAQAKRSAIGAPVRDPMDDGAKLIRRQALDFVENADGPFFLFLNFMEAHAPYSPMRGMDPSLYSAPSSWTSATMEFWDVVTDPDEYAADLERLRELYAANVEYLDRVVAEFLVRLEEVTERETTAIVTADHGENLGYPGEDGLLEHKSSLSESLLHVPFEVVNPPTPAPEIESGLVSHRRLPTLVTGLLDDRFPSIATDRAAAEHVGLSPGPDPPRDEDYWDRMMRCAYDGTHKYVWDSLGATTAYRIDLAEPCRERKVAEDVTVPEWARTMFDTDIETYKGRAKTRAAPGTEAIDETTKQRLAELGYI